MVGSDPDFLESEGGDSTGGKWGRATPLNPPLVKREVGNVLFPFQFLVYFYFDPRKKWSTLIVQQSVLSSNP